MRLYYIIKMPLQNALFSRILKSPSRILANDLKVSRSTIIKTYELLLLEKYIVSKVGSGYTTASTVYDSAILEKPLKRVQIILQFQKSNFISKKTNPY
jgi:GntR family transcriptional regulator/MocR family aminotransferase